MTDDIGRIGVNECGSYQAWKLVVLRMKKVRYYGSVLYDSLLLFVSVLRSSMASNRFQFGDYFPTNP